MKKMTLTEVLKAAEKQGVKITPQTFEYYKRFELLPKPHKTGKRREGIYGYYPPVTVNILLKIDKLKKEFKGKHKLEELKLYVHKSAVEEFLKALKELGFSDFYLQEMAGISLTWEQKHQMIKENWQERKTRYSDVEWLKNFSPSQIASIEIREELLDGFLLVIDRLCLRCWDSKETIRFFAGAYVYGNLQEKIRNLQFSYHVLLVKAEKMEGDKRGAVMEGAGELAIHREKLIAKLIEVKAWIDKVSKKLEPPEIEEIEKRAKKMIII